MGEIPSGSPVCMVCTVLAMISLSGLDYSARLDSVSFCINYLAMILLIFESDIQAKTISSEPLLGSPVCLIGAL